VHSTTVDAATGEQIVLLPVEQLGLPDRYKKPWGNYLYKVLVYRTDQGVIWGITARIVNDVAEKFSKIARSI